MHFIMTFIYMMENLTFHLSFLQPSLSHDHSEIIIIILNGEHYNVHKCVKQHNLVINIDNNKKCFFEH